MAKQIKVTITSRENTELSEYGAVIGYQLKQQEIIMPERDYGKFLMNSIDHETMHSIKQEAL